MSPEDAEHEELKRCKDISYKMFCFSSAHWSWPSLEAWKLSLPINRCTRYQPPPFLYSSASKARTTVSKTNVCLGRSITALGGLRFLGFSTCLALDLLGDLRLSVPGYLRLYKEPCPEIALSFPIQSWRGTWPWIWFIYAHKCFSPSFWKPANYVKNWKCILCGHRKDGLYRNVWQRVCE